MKSMISGLILALAIATPATAQDFYLQGDIGVDLYPDNSIDDIGFEIGPGATLGGRFGADLQIVRVELDVSLSAAVIDLENDPGSDDLDYYHVAVQGGIYRDFAQYFYAGGGAGFVYQEVSTEILGQDVEDDETNFVAHGELGLNFDINDAVAIVPHYRVTWLPGFDTDDEVFQHSLRLGVRFGL